MKRDMIYDAHSSFLGVPKDIAYIMNMILKNPNVGKLLWYNVPDCLSKPAIGSKEISEMLKTKQISTQPKVKVDEHEKTYLIITFDNYIPNDSNTFYRDHNIEVRIITHFDLWDLTDNDVRIYRLAGEIDSMLNGAKMSGIGITNFVNAVQDVYDEEYVGLTLTYRVVRGTEDQKEEVRPMI